MNNRITPKERGLIKGAIRRVFSRSDLRRKLVESTRIAYTDPERPRVKKWSICQLCNMKTPTYKMQVDHIDPIVPINATLEDMTWDLVIDRIWCLENNLQVLCFACHNEKTKSERKLRRLAKQRRSEK